MAGQQPVPPRDSGQWHEVGRTLRLLVALLLLTALVVMLLRGVGLL